MSIAILSSTRGPTSSGLDVHKETVVACLGLRRRHGAPVNKKSRKRAPGPMTARGDSLGCSRNPGSNYYAGLTHQLMIDLDADDAAKVSVFHSLWVGKAGGELLQGSPPLSGASVLSASRLEPLVPCM